MMDALLLVGLLLSIAVIIVSALGLILESDLHIISKLVVAVITAAVMVSASGAAATLIVRIMS